MKFDQPNWPEIITCRYILDFQDLIIDMLHRGPEFSHNYLIGFIIIIPNITKKKLLLGM